MPGEIANLDPHARRRLIVIGDQIARQRRAYPITGARLWHSERSSQLRAAQADFPMIKFIFGGNRSGKTECGALLTLCAAAGLGCWWVDQFLQKNGIDPRQFREGPQRVWAVSRLFSDSRRVLRRKFDRYAPTGSSWRAKEGNGEAELTLPNGGVIVFKSSDQRREAFQADSVYWILVDEEPPEGVWGEILMRIVDQAGKILCTMTPLSGRTWIYDRYVEQPDQDTRIFWLSSTDNPLLDGVFLKKAVSKMSDAEREARLHGRFGSRSGTIWPEFSRSIHVCHPSEMPAYRSDSMQVFGAIDFGSRNPFCFLIAYFDYSACKLYILGEWFHANLLLQDHAQGIGSLCARFGQPWAISADPEDRQSRQQLASMGIATIAAKKAVLPSINLISGLLRLDEWGDPGLVISSDCPNLIREIEGYIWEDGGRERPRKVNDHAIDAMRYLAELCDRMSRG